jgi:uncharacterized protein YbcI
MSNAIVRIHAKYYGRGPTKARAHIHDAFALVVLEEVFTPAERTLTRAGRYEQVVNMRDAFQDALKAEFIEAAEEITGRTVRAFISEINVDPELAIELFLFEPDVDDDAEPKTTEGAVEP